LAEEWTVVMKEFWQSYDQGEEAASYEKGIAGQTERVCDQTKSVASNMS